MELKLPSKHAITLLNSGIVAATNQPVTTVSKIKNCDTQMVTNKDPSGLVAANQCVQDRKRTAAVVVQRRLVVGSTSIGCGRGTSRTDTDSTSSGITRERSTAVVPIGYL